MSKLELILGGKKESESIPQVNIEIYQVDYDIDDVILSGFNVIRRYQGDWIEDTNQRILSSINQALTITETLIDNGFEISSDIENANWFIGQEINTITGPIELGIHKYIIDKIYTKLKPEDQNPIYVLDVAISTYFDTFLDFFNEKTNLLMLYESKKDVKRRAMINNEQNMLKLLEISRQYPEYEMTFKGNKGENDRGLPDFYIPRDRLEVVK